MSSTEVTVLPFIHPATGEAFFLADLDGADLGAVVDELADLAGRVDDCKRELVAEVSRRADQSNARKVELGGYVFEVNAPTADTYDVGDVLAELEPFIGAGVITAAVLEDVIRRPPPKPSPPAVDLRRINTLWKSDNAELLAALARARRRAPTLRTARIVSRPVNATAEED